MNSQLSEKQPEPSKILKQEKNTTPTKKVRFTVPNDDTDNISNNEFSKNNNNECSLKPHPMGIKPEGNLYLDFNSSEPVINRKMAGLGFLAAVSDELILTIFNLLTPDEVIKLALVSHAFYAFSYFDEPWKEKTIQEFDGDFDFKGTWRLTYINRRFKHSCSYDLTPFPIQTNSFYSDFLFQPWLCASTDISSFLGKENIDRRSNLSLEEFQKQYEIPNRPVIITDIVSNWPASKEWTKDKLLSRYGDISFRAEAIDITLQRYFEYSRLNKDESPVYLFDKSFGNSCPSMLADFQVPEYFQEDLFQLLGDRRPDYRWLIIGPARSGSTFHKDPNATSAWNAVITGAKKWILFPPNCPPPGVYTSPDESEVTAPVSIMDWHLNYYLEAVSAMDTKPIEAICRAGEIMFVPSGWWHLVVNLEDSIALTQNYVSHQNAEKVLNFLFNKPEQVSGWRFDPDCQSKDTLVNPPLKYQSLFDAFVEKYQPLNPELVSKIKSKPLSCGASNSAWDILVNQANSQGGFSFGFDVDDDSS